MSDNMVSDTMLQDTMLPETCYHTILPDTMLPDTLVLFVESRKRSKIKEETIYISRVNHFSVLQPVNKEINTKTSVD